MRKRIYSLDFLKFCATICIIFHHYQLYLNIQFPSGINFVLGRFEFSYLVELFFVLSGFFISTYVDKISDGMSFKDFFVPKYIRFLSPVAASTVTFAILNLYYEKLYSEQFFMRTPTIWNTLTASLGFTTGWISPPSKMNGPIWYISALLVCYVIFYFVTFMAKKLKGTPYWAYAFLIFLAFRIRVDDINFLFFDSGTARGISSFFGGIILAKAIRGKCISNKHGIFAFLAFSVILLVLLRYRNSYSEDGLGYLCTFLLYPMLIIVLLSPLAQKVFRTEFWGWIGSISFEAYIWHFPILIFVMNMNKRFPLNLNYANRITSFIYAAICFIVGIVCYYLVERPAGDFLMRKIFGQCRES